MKLQKIIMVFIGTIILLTMLLISSYSSSMKKVISKPVSSTPTSLSVTYQSNSKKPIITNSITSPSTQLKSLRTNLKNIPDGEYLAYNKEDGLHIKNIANNYDFSLVQIPNSWIALSPDKNYVAYSQSGNAYIYDVINDKERQIISSGNRCTMPEWAHDSKKVVFVCGDDIGSDLYIFFLPDISVEKITDCLETQDNCEYPKWSSDGKMIAYNRKTAYSGNSNRDGLYILDIQCEKKENCVSKNNGPFDYIGSFTWSPDNKHLAGTSNGILKIYNYDKNQVSIAEKLSKIEYTYEIIWSKDGKFLALSTINSTSLYSFDKKIIEQIDLPNGSLVSDWILFP